MGVIRVTEYVCRLKLDMEEVVEADSRKEAEEYMEEMLYESEYLQEKIFDNIEIECRKL